MTCPLHDLDSSGSSHCQLCKAGVSQRMYHPFLKHRVTQLQRKANVFFGSHVVAMNVRVALAERSPLIQSLTLDQDVPQLIAHW